MIQIPNLWKDKDAPKDPADQLVYASNLLGSDLRITNFGGGNTSVKCTEVDSLTGEKTRVMWVKGSGGDLGSAKKTGFASLYLDKVLGLEEKKRREGLHEDKIVPLYEHCAFGLNRVACSIDTPLHAFVPFDAVAHTHADAVIAIAASEGAELLTREVWGDEMGFLPWKRPGFDLALQLRDLIKKNPKLKGVLLASHGFTCWTDDWKSCYELALRLINRAQETIDSKSGKVHAFGAVVSEPVNDKDARKQLIEYLPTLRGRVEHQGRRLIAHIDTDQPTLDFMSREKMGMLTEMGTSCPDHFLRTKIRPMVLTDLPSGDGLGATLDSRLEDYREMYAGYYERCKRHDSPAMRNPNPSVVLIPGVGMVSFGKSANEAKITGQFYRNAIEVMRGAETVSKYTALPEQEAFDIEYWQLEEAKLKRSPLEKELSRQIAVITGGAQGIGFATAQKMSELGACVVILDINEQKLADAESTLNQSAPKGTVMAIKCDVTDPSSVQNAIEETILGFGGLDICVACAGNARRGTVMDTTDKDYDFLSDLLMKGYFNTMRAASRVMAKQGTGGSIVVVASKNGTAVGSNAAVYSAAKAFELHLMRTAAADLALYGIRCNAVNPDAVLEGSAIWSDQWRNETAKLLGIKPEDLPEYYRKRSLLGVTVSTDDIAEAICWLASEKRSGKTTGCVITVDGGVKEGFLR